MTYFVWFKVTEGEPNPFKPPYRVKAGGMSVDLGLEAINPHSSQPLERLTREVERRYRKCAKKTGRLAARLIAWRKIPYPEPRIRITDIRPL